jgi:hypothetical protein
MRSTPTPERPSATPTIPAPRYGPTDPGALHTCPRSSSPAPADDGFGIASIALHTLSLVRRRPLSAAAAGRLEDPLASLLLDGLIRLHIDVLRIGATDGYLGAAGAARDLHTAHRMWIGYVHGGMDPLSEMSCIDGAGPGLLALRAQIRAFALIEEPA